MFSFYLGSFYCFLVYLKSVRKTTCTKVMQKLWCSKLLKYYNEIGQMIRRFLLFLVLYIRFLFESLKLIKQFSSRFDYFLQLSSDISMLKRVEIFQHFSKNIYPAQNFSCSTSMFLISLPSKRGVSFLEQRQLFQSLKMIETLHQNVNFETECSIIVPQWKHKKLFFI